MVALIIKVNAIRVIVITLCYVFLLLQNVSILWRRLIDTNSYCSWKAIIFISSDSYHFSPMGALTKSHNYHSIVIKISIP